MVFYVSDKGLCWPKGKHSRLWEKLGVLRWEWGMEEKNGYQVLSIPSIKSCSCTSGWRAKQFPGKKTQESKQKMGAERVQDGGEVKNVT